MHRSRTFKLSKRIESRKHSNMRKMKKEKKCDESKSKLKTSIDLCSSILLNSVVKEKLFPNVSEKLNSR